MQKKNRNIKYQNGEVYPVLIQIKNMIKDDRWYPFADFLPWIDAQLGDLLGVNEDLENIKLSCSTIDKSIFKIEDIEFEKLNGEEIIKKLKLSVLDDIDIDSISIPDYIFQVRSNNRIGPKNQILLMFEKLGIIGNDWPRFTARIDPTDKRRHAWDMDFLREINGCLIPLNNLKEVKSIDG